jgi:glycosyltransferase A (GT-A) superfamily protein (DUF2064 family)
VPCGILVVAKAPVPGLAKTRLAATYGAEGAADLAAGALLDTLVAVEDAEVSARIVALTGEIGRARRAGEIAARLDRFTVIPQRGDRFAERLVAAHADAAALAGVAILQIGMDTPQVSGPVLSAAAGQLVDDAPGAVLGPAADGGWWALGITDPRWALALEGVPMSRPDTGTLTRAGLARLGVRVGELPELTDVDTDRDVWSVVAELGVDSYFRSAVEALGGGPPVRPTRPSTTGC